MPLGQDTSPGIDLGYYSIDTSGNITPASTLPPYYGYTPPAVVTIAGAQTAPITVSSPASAGQSQLYSLVSGGIQGAAQILGTRYAVPQLTPGQYIQRTPQGSVMYQMPTNTSSITGGLFPATGPGGGVSPTVLLIGAGLLAVMLFSRKGSS